MFVGNAHTQLIAIFDPILHGSSRNAKYFSNCFCWRIVGDFTSTHRIMIKNAKSNTMTLFEPEFAPAFFCIGDKFGNVSHANFF